MTIVKKEKKGNIVVITVEKDYDDEKMEKKMNTLIRSDHIKTIIDYNADIYTNDGKLLLRFRKKALDNEHVDAFYDNIIKFARNSSGLRGKTSGSKSETSYSDKKVMSNI